MKRRRSRSIGLALPWEQGNRERLREWFRPRGLRRIAGLLLLGAFTALAWHRSDSRARLRETRLTIDQVQDAVRQFRIDLGRCPNSMSELLHPPRAMANYLDRVPLDGWGHPLYVRCPSRVHPDEAEVISSGASGNWFSDEHVE